ncbi:MAG: phosphatidylserine decarboxylase family protein [Bacteroidota bacterium]
MKLHREGKVTIPISILVIAGLVWAGFAIHAILGYIFAFLGVALVLLVFNFFRNPDIDIATDPKGILSPCDGKVVVIEEVEDEVYFHGKVRQISVFMSPLNVHVNRNPISGSLKKVQYFPGKYLMAFNPKSSQLNEQTYVVAENDLITIAYKQIAGFLARRIKWYVQENDQVEQGGEYGFIKFGSRIDILMPLSANVTVQLGDKVLAGRTTLATV